jgi:hypothetical protein
MRKFDIGSAVLAVIFVSILVSLFATWIKLIPRYPKWKYAVIQQLTNALLQTIFVTLIFWFELPISWFPLFAVTLLILWVSVEYTKQMVRRAERRLPMGRATLAE